MPGERRVALIPEVVKALTKAGTQITSETNAGLSAGYPDEGYTASGGTVTGDRSKLYGLSLIHI